MGIIGATKKHRVDIIESERGWGQKIDEVKYFDSEKEAKDFCDEFNNDNDYNHVPDWYMMANYTGIIKEDK